MPRIHLIILAIEMSDAAVTNPTPTLTPAPAPVPGQLGHAGVHDHHETMKKFVISVEKKRLTLPSILNY